MSLGFCFPSGYPRQNLDILLMSLTSPRAAAVVWVVALIGRFVEDVQCASVRDTELSRSGGVVLSV